MQEEPQSLIAETTTMDGGGQQAAGRAIGFARLGYQTALFVDSDARLDPPVTIAAEAGVRVIQWADLVSTEERIARDLPDKDLERFVRLAIELVEYQEAVLSAIGAQLPAGTARLETPDVLSWVSPDTPVDVIREAIGKASEEEEVVQEHREGANV